MRVVPTEDQDQAALARWMTLQRIKFFAIPNGGSRHIAEAVKLKRCGVQRGIPDLCIPIPSGSYHGLFLELKRERGGKVSFEQVEWLRFLREQGYYAEIAYGFEEAKKIVTEYLAMTPKAA
jgi:hypothetical protein